MINLQEKITAIFPEVGQIPEQFQIHPLHHKEYLVGGEMRQWTGATQDVYSPIYVKNGDKLESLLIGS